MFKTEIILIAIAMSWFLCSERPETGVQVSDSEVADGGKTITEATDDIEGYITPEPEPTGVTRTEVLVKLGALAALATIVLAVF